MTTIRAIADRFTGVVASCAIVVGLGTSCGDETPSTSVLRQADMYEAAVAHLIETSGVEFSEGWSGPVIFVAALEDEGVDLETQVAVVDDFEDDYRIRFVDAIAEAVDLDAAGLPVREGTVLIALGPIQVDGTDYELHAEYYLGDDDRAAFRFHFEDRQPASGERPEMVLNGEPAEVATQLVVEAP